MTNTTINTQKLSSLLPYDPSKKTGGTELKAGLREFSLLLIALDDATTAVENRNWAEFDALVSENACQIRALKNACNASAYSLSERSLCKRVSYSKQSIEKISRASLDICGKQKKTLRNFLEDKVDVELSEEELFLTQCYLLFVAKIDFPQQKGSLRGAQQSQAQNLRRFDRLNTGTFQFDKSPDSKNDQVSKKFLENLVNELRIKVARESVTFIRELAESFGEIQLKKLCSSEFEVSYQNRPCIPMFWTYKTLLLTAKKKGIPIVLTAKFIVKGEEDKVIREESLYFKPEKEVLTEAAIVIEGWVSDQADRLLSSEEWKASIKAQALTEIILSGAADHRQYPDDNLNSKIEDLRDSEFESYQKKAQKEGFSEKNPSCFFIRHVYAQAIARIPKNIEEVPLI